MTKKEVDNIIYENEDYIIHWIEDGKTKTWIANYLGITINALNGGLERAKIDYKYIKSQALDIKKQEELVNFKAIQWIDDNFDYIMQCIINDVPVTLVALKLNISLNQAIKDLTSYGIILKGMKENDNKNKKDFKGPSRIKEILDAEGISYKREYTFSDCRFEDTNALARFDFAIFENNKLSYLIEYDGEQHQKAVKHWGGEEGLLKRQEHDQLKNDYCYFNGIPLIRIPYDYNLDYLSYSDLDPRYSDFLL